MDTQNCWFTECKTPLQHLKKTIWQYGSGVLEVILLFGSIILPLVCNPKEKMKNVGKGFHGEKVIMVCYKSKIEHIKMKQSKCPTNRQSIECKLHPLKSIFIKILMIQGDTLFYNLNKMEYEITYGNSGRCESI